SFFPVPATPLISTLSLHDALPISISTNHWDARAALTNSSPVRISIAGVTANPKATPVFEAGAGVTPTTGLRFGVLFAHGAFLTRDRKSTRLNSSHVSISYAVFCLK